MDNIIKLKQKFKNSMMYGCDDLEKEEDVLIL